jgi:hypothetical protein|tara:strand:- start:112 stop:345 length:234 start_codon:yes stop_codon:yes gene_type:complete
MKKFICYAWEESACLVYAESDSDAIKKLKEFVAFEVYKTVDVESLEQVEKEKINAEEDSSEIGVFFKPGSDRYIGKK